MGFGETFIYSDVKSFIFAPAGVDLGPDWENQLILLGLPDQSVGALLGSDRNDPFIYSDDKSSNSNNYQRQKSL